MSALVQGFSRLNSISLPLTGQISKRFFVSEIKAQKPRNNSKNTSWDIHDYILFVTSVGSIAAFSGVLADYFRSQKICKDSSKSQPILKGKVYGSDLNQDSLDKKVDTLAKTYLDGVQK
jgi:hypothetical protein